MIRAIDLFCGTGGSSWGARAAGAKIVAGFDMWELAVLNYMENFPEARTYSGKLESIDVPETRKDLGKIDLILASPECTSHTHARGRRPPSEDSRLTAYQVLRFARVMDPRWLVIENVVNMKSWAKYAQFLERLRGLGYRLREQTLDAADFGVPQSRRRLFITGDKKRTPPEVTPPQRERLVPVRDILHMDGLYPFSPLQKPRRAKATLDRARRASAGLGGRTPFLVVYYSTDCAGGWQSIEAPLRTVTTIDRFALVKKRDNELVMRMLQPDELRAAMGFPGLFKLKHGTRRDRIRLLGNAVCPPVIKSIVSALTAD